MRRNTSSGSKGGLSMAKGIPPLSDDLAPFYHGMGRYIGMFSLLDQWLGSVLLRMISPGKAMLTFALPIVAGSDFRVKLAHIKHLSAMHQASTRPTIVKACNGLQDLYERRNELAHAAITPSKKKGFVELIDLRVTSDGEMRPHKIISLENIETWFERLGVEASTLARAITEAGYPPMGKKEDEELFPGPLRNLKARRDQSEPRTDPPKKEPRPSKPRSTSDRKQPVPKKS